MRHRANSTPIPLSRLLRLSWPASSTAKHLHTHRTSQHIRNYTYTHNKRTDIHLDYIRCICACGCVCFCVCEYISKWSIHDRKHIFFFHRRDGATAGNAFSSYNDGGASSAHYGVCVYVCVLCICVYDVICVYGYLRERVRERERVIVVCVVFVSMCVWISFTAAFLFVCRRKHPRTHTHKQQHIQTHTHTHTHTHTCMTGCVYVWP